MPKQNIDHIRIQQFRIFKQLFNDANLTVAAHTLGITQSAASKQLTSLRDHFGDDLFVRTSLGMQSTEKAQSIAPSIFKILDEIQHLTLEDLFDPAKINMRFVICTTDEIQYNLAPQLLEVIEKQAPNLELQFVNLENSYALNGLESGSVNMVISVNWTAPENLVQSRLFDDPFICLMAKDNPLADMHITMENYIKFPHVLVAPLGHTQSLVDVLLSKNDLKRKVPIILPNFMEVGRLIEGSNNIITLPQRTAAIIRQKHDLHMAPPAFELPTVTYYQFWHQRYRNDQTRMWFFNLIREFLSNPT